MTSRTVFPGIPILASKGFLGKLDREDKVRVRPSAPRPCHVPTDQLEFLLHPVRPQKPAWMHPVPQDVAHGDAVTGTSSALKSTFPAVKGHAVGQRSSSNPVPPSRDGHESWAFLSLQPEGGFYSKPTGQIRSLVSVWQLPRC